MFKNLFFKHRKSDVIELKQSFYSCSINDKVYEFKSKESMLNFISEYSTRNSIYSLGMFRCDMFNLIK